MVLYLLYSRAVALEFPHFDCQELHFFGFAETVAPPLELFGAGLAAPFSMSQPQPTVHFANHAVGTILDGLLQECQLEVITVGSHCLLYSLLLLSHLFELLATHLPLLVLHSQVPSGLVVAFP